MRWLGLIFAVFAAFASFGIGCATQVNAIATVCNENLGISDMAVVGDHRCVLYSSWLSLVESNALQGSVRRLVPFMALFYVLGCIVILGINYDYLIPAMTTICNAWHSSREQQPAVW